MANFWKMLIPTRVVQSVKELDADELKAQGVKAIITDLDNTLVPWRHYEIAPGVIEWLAKLEVAGIKICIASNTIHTARLKQLADTMHIPFVERVQKPRRGGFVRAMQLMNSRPADTAVFGDQLFTDVLAGNRLGLTTILIRPPLSKEEFISTQIVRYVENAVIRRLRQRDLWPVAQALEQALESLPDPRAPEVRRVSNTVLVGLALALTGMIVWVGLRQRA
jgi:hypothetical protein